MTQKTIRFVGASRVNHLVLPFFFNRTFPLSPRARQRALRYAEEATAVVRAYYRRSDYPHCRKYKRECWEVSPSALAAYAFFLRGIARGRVFRYGAIFHSVGIAAASLKHVEVLQWLIREGIPLDELHEEEDTVLSVAIRYHHEDLARALMDAFPRFTTGLLASSATLTCIYSGSTPLFFEMVERGFPVSFRTWFKGWITSPLSAAVRRKRHTITRYLLKHALTETNVGIKGVDSDNDRSVWRLVYEAVRAQNREVIEVLKRLGVQPTAETIKDYCYCTNLLWSLDNLQFSEEVYPDLPLRDYVASLRMDEDCSLRIDEAVLQHCNLPPYEAEYSERVQQDWRHALPTTLNAIGDCLAERPAAILRLLPALREQLRCYYQHDHIPYCEAPSSLYALCLAQFSDTPLFTQQELQALVDKDDDFHYYSFRVHAAALGVQIPKHTCDDSESECWRAASLQGAELQAFLDQSDEVLAAYQTFYDIPMVRFVAEASTVEALELWMERGFPICACEENESWHPTHYANPEIMEYYLRDVGLHYRTRACVEGDVLAWAIRDEEVDCVKVILKYGYPLNSRKCNDDYPLTYAFLRGAERVARVLYEAGAKMLDRQGHVMPLPPWFKP